jgi:sugar/nucleoside kinase (ribokinase family)
VSKRRFDTIVIGELNIDLVLWDVPMPENEKEKLAKDMRFAMGSSSAITAHNLSMIGSQVGFIGKAGKDNFGDFMIQQLQKGGVDTSGIIQNSNLKTGATIVLANPPKKALLTYMGAMTELTINDMDWDYLSQTKHLHLGCYYLQTGMIDSVPALFTKAKKLGLTTSLDTNWDPSEKWKTDIYEALRVTDIFFPNDEEAIHIAHEGSLEDAIRKLSEMVKVLVVKAGKNGAILGTEGKRLISSGFQVKMVETTGAGDSFNAGFLHAYLNGKNWEECLNFGNACGALAVTDLGGTGAFKDKKTVARKLNIILNA